MLYATWLLLQGSWEQTLINWDVAAPASGLSTGWFYGVGIVFGVSTGLILLADLYRAVTGKLSDEELVMVKESEEQEELEALQHELAERDRREGAACRRRTHTREGAAMTIASSSAPFSAPWRSECRSPTPC